MVTRGFPVVIAQNGKGFPVRPVPSNAPPMRVAENDIGAPIVISELGAPFILEGGIPPLVPGPLEVVERFPGSFTNFKRPFGLASDAAVVGFACVYTGNPVITITHGGEPLTIVAQTRVNNTLTLLAVGTDLTMEVADLEIAVTGGTLNGGVLRINEMKNVDAALVGWKEQRSAGAPPIPALTMTGTSGGVVKGVFASNGVDIHHTNAVGGTNTVFGGYIVVGPNIPEDFSTSGAWNIEPGWTVDGTYFVHTGPLSKITLDHTRATSTASTQCHIEVSTDRGSFVQISTSTRDTYGPGSVGYVSTAFSSQDKCEISASGDVRVLVMNITTGGTSLAWTFFTTDAVDGAQLQPRMTYRPAWGVSAAEVLGEDYA